MIFLSEWGDGWEACEKVFALFTIYCSVPFDTLYLASTIFEVFKNKTK